MRKKKNDVKKEQRRKENKGRKEKEKGGEKSIFSSQGVKVIIFILSIKFFMQLEVDF